MRTNVPDVVASYVDHLQRTASSRRWQTDRSQLARFALHVHAFTAGNVRRALAVLEEDDELGATYRKDTWNTWARFIRWAVEWEHIDAKIWMRASAFTPSFADDRPEARSVPELRVVLEDLAKLTPHDRDFVRLLLLTAARPSEILNLRTADVNIDELPYFARLSKHKSSSKTSKPRVLVFNHAAAVILDAYRTPFTPDDFIFPKRSDPWAPCPITTIAQRLRRRGVRFTLYDCRRIAARFVRTRSDLDSSQAMLGHSRASTTEIYAPVDITKAAAAASILERIIR